MKSVVRWADILGYEGCYQISDDGKVKSLPKTRKLNHGGIQHVPERILKPYLGRDGYPYINLCRNYVIKHGKIHRLVALAFITNPEGKPHVNHKDGNKLNNSYKNLEWVTRKENAEHAVRTGLAVMGSRSHLSKITEGDIPIILGRIKNGETMSLIGKDYGVSGSNISHIKIGDSWKQETSKYQTQGV